MLPIARLWYNSGMAEKKRFEVTMQARHHSDGPPRPQPVGPPPPSSLFLLLQLLLADSVSRLERQARHAAADGCGDGGTLWSRMDF